MIFNELKNTSLVTEANEEESALVCAFRTFSLEIYWSAYIETSHRSKRVVLPSIWVLIVCISCEKEQERITIGI